MINTLGETGRKHTEKHTQNLMFDEHYVNRDISCSVEKERTRNKKSLTFHVSSEKFMSTL